jgi:hypothetical protein
VIISFPGGATALAVEARPDASGEDLLAALQLPAASGATVVLNGSAADLDDRLAARLDAVVGGDGLAGVAGREGLTVVTGGTDAGIFSILGHAMVDRSAPVIGVAPSGLVAWPGGPATGGVALEPHHSHFVLVDGPAVWGAETAALLALVEAMDRTAPSVAVICGGGPVTCREALGHVRDGRPLVVVSGSGRVADDLAAAAAGSSPVSADVAEIVALGHLTVCPLAAGGVTLVAAVLAVLAPPG